MNDEHVEALSKVVHVLEAELADLLELHHMVTLEEIRRRCWWRRLSGIEGPDVLFIDGVPVLELDPPTFTEERQGDRVIVHYTQNFRRL